MLQTTAQMGFKHLPGEGRTFGQDLFCPSCYISVGGDRGTQGSSEWMGANFIPSRGRLFWRCPCCLPPLGQAQRWGSLLCIFSVPLLPTHRSAPSCSTTGTASNRTTWDGEGESSGSPVEPREKNFMCLSRAATSRLPQAVLGLPCLASADPQRFLFGVSG